MGKVITGVEKSKFDYNAERFADVDILRYRVEEWESLSLNQKKLLYCLSEAALQGRDIIFDQNNRYNLAIRRVLEAIYSNYQGDILSKDYENFVIYMKKVWFYNGIHYHHYGEEKFLPGFSKDFFVREVQSLDPFFVPMRKGQSVNNFLTEIIPVMFESSVYAKKVNQNSGLDVIATSANNYYGEDITQVEVEQFYSAMKTSTNITPITYGLNSRLVKKNGFLTEEVYKIGGLYSSAIEQIVYWLKEASQYAENRLQKRVILSLIEYYQTGCLEKYDEYAIQWVQDTVSRVDFVNGFIESYGDSLGIKASWESIVNFKSLEATAFFQLISNNAQWFEDHSPVASQFKKKEVKGVSVKVITVSILGGDCYPSTPIGVNLPNSDWIRKDYGSKSVIISNIIDAYDKASSGNGFIDEFVYGEQEKKLIKQYGSRTDNLHTALHECLGHASGQLLPGVDSDVLRIYGSTIEEARADLFGLYYIPDDKMLDLGLLPTPEAYKAEYYKFLMNGSITQLARIKLGKEIEEAHMRSRALISHYILDVGYDEDIARLIRESGKTYVVINNYEKMRELIGKLLARIQRIKSEGDFNDAQYIVEKYAVLVDIDLHKEILKRYAYLNISPYKGFINPVYTAVRDIKGNIIDVKISYNENYSEQMLRYSRDYSHLPTYNEVAK
ncbi:dipeptidyl-peptidase 3 family protein [Candidatus Azobacteroides pseudotrichonymphae]|uniref:Dipeptidyl-peptidase III n=1 Tax=Azobacteroides pseudotrichonymphae genomovar. CFP2 TaxID=511995 RepID=B6YS19_AZOPC|nr:dihydrofolate reductase [Candidatus Azobacteroides pseudotrichonymphae]BAG83991.1 dipeptidyl-peptidase III [Candidatus Azobacteroides pseudotrichonymphae genomovar. CFP2]